MSLLYTICRYTTSKYEFFKELDIFFATYQTQKKSFFWLLIQQKFIIIYAVQRLSYISILCYKKECRHVSTTYVFGPGVDKWKHLTKIQKKPRKWWHGKFLPIL